MVNKDFQKVKSQLAGSGGILWRLPAQLVVLAIHYEFRFRTRNKSHVRFCFLCIKQHVRGNAAYNVSPCRVTLYFWTPSTFIALQHAMHAYRDIVLTNLSVCPMPVLCLNECTYRHTFNCLVGAWFISDCHRCSKFQGNPSGGFKYMR